MHNERLAKVIDVVSFVFVIISILLLPLFLDHSLINTYIIPKQYALGAVALGMSLLWVIRLVLTRKLTYRKSILDWSLISLLGVGLVTAVFSVNIYDSFWGRSEYFVFNFIFLFFSVLYYFLLVNQINSRVRWQWVLNFLLLAGGISVSLFLFKSFFNPSWLDSWWGISTWNPIDSSNSVFGLWVVVIFVLSAGRLIKKDLSISFFVFNFLIALLSLIGIIFLGFSFLWWIMLFGIVLLLFLGVNFIKEARLWWLSALFAVLVMTAIFIVFGQPKLLQANLPTEVSLGMKASWNFTSATTLSNVKNFLVGTGLGTFNYDFSRFRTVDFNMDKVAWSLRFSQPFNSFFALLAEGGVLLTLFFVFIFLFVLGHVFFVWYKMRLDGMLRSLTLDLVWKKNDTRLETFLIMVAWAILSVGLFTSFYGPVMWWLWWLLLALLISGVSFINPNIISTREWELEDVPQYNLSFSFLMIVVVAAVIMSAVWGARLYSAESYYAAAVHSSDAGVAEQKLKEAISRHESVDIFHVLLAQVYLLQASDLSKTEKPDVQVVNTLVAQAVNSAKRATDISPNSVVVWENLITMYENAATLVPEARDWAIKSLLKAKELEPSNPTLAWRLGNNYSALGKWEEASKSYQEAIGLKADYVGAYIGLANVFEQNKQFDKAIDLYKKILPNVGGQIDVLYNLGRLLYNRNSVGDRAEAERLWLRAVELGPNYSNALYSLGLLYENKGDRTKALQYYYRARDLNPTNKDLIAKIKSLVGAVAETKKK